MGAATDKSSGPGSDWGRASRWRILCWTAAAALLLLPFLAMQVMGDARSAAAELLVIGALVGSAALALVAALRDRGGAPAADQ